MRWVDECSVFVGELNKIIKQFTWIPSAIGILLVCDTISSYSVALAEKAEQPWYTKVVACTVVLKLQPG